MNWPCQVDWGGLPSSAPAILKVPRALPQVWSGDVPRQAGSGSPVASCLDKHASTALVDRHLRGPSGTLTLAHCSSSCQQFSASPSCLLAPATPEQVLGLITATPVGIAGSGCSKCTLLFRGHSFNQEPKQHIVESHLTDKSLTDFWTSLIAQLVKNPPAMQETLAQFLGLG